MLSLEITSNLKCLEGQLDAFLVEIHRSRKRLLGRESKLVMELNSIKARVTELKTSLESSPARVLS